MKILFIAPTFEGGIGGHALRVAEKLREVGFDVKLMSAPHIPIRKLKNPSFALVSSIKAIFSNEKFDVVHAFNVPSAFAMKYIKARKRVLSVHGIYSDQVDALHSRTIASLAKLAESIVLKWADRLATDSKIVQKVYKEKYGLDFEFLFAPLDIEKFNGIPDVQKKENKIIYIGRDSYEKGIDILRGIESKLNGHVTFCTNLSWRDAMIELKSSSILVVPSRMESIPQVIKEAFYLGIPVIATNVGGIPEIIVNGQNGILVPPQDPEKLTSAINDLLNNKEMANRLSHSGHEYVMKNLTWDALLPKYVKFYEDLFKN